MFTANSPKRRKALRRFGDRARSTGVNVHSQFPEAPQGLAAHTDRETYDRERYRDTDRET